MLLDTEFLIFDVCKIDMRLKTQYLINFLALIVISSFFSSCKTPMERADDAMTIKNYAEAAEIYKEISKDPKATKEDRQTATFRGAQCYNAIHKPKAAMQMYQKALDRGVKDPLLLFNLGDAYKQNGEYQTAIEYFQKYQKEVPSDPRTEVMIQGCEDALTWAEAPTRYKVNEFKPANESGSDDFSPVWADRKNNTIMFTSDRLDGASKEVYSRTGRNHTDVWVIQKERSRRTEKWGEPEVVEGLNTKLNDGVITFNKRMSKMYLTQCNGMSGKEKTCKIYEARKVGTGWEINPEPLPFCIDGTGDDMYKWHYGHPVLADNDKTMYFASDRPGGYGDTTGQMRTKDIWMVTYVRRGRTWSEPVNLGPAINTEHNEMFPYVHSDGTLYFSSDGHPGIGALDIFESSKTGEGPTDWSTPKNMKSPINSKGDDFSIIMDDTKEYGLFTSTRKNDQDDIYEFYMEPIVCTLRGQVTDCDSGTAIANALVVVSNNVDSSKIRLVTDDKGYYETELGINREFTIEVSKREDYYYDAKPQYVSTMGVENSIDCQHVKDFCLKNTCNDVFVLPIYYDLDKAYIREDAKPNLDDLISTLKKYPKMAVELGSHTDCRADYEYNRALSQRRADSAIAYIIDHGEINPFRLEARGYGESQLVNHCECEGAVRVPCSDEEHQANRRTTIKVVNCNFDVLSIGVDYALRNDDALGGKGSIYSPYLLEKQRDYLIETKGNIDSFLRAKEVEDSLKQVELEMEAFLAKYDFVPLSTRGKNQLVTAEVGRRKVKFIFTGEDRRTEVPEEMVVRWLEDKVITVDNFKNSNDKIKLSNGTKVFSNSFTLPELKIGDKTYTNVKCKLDMEAKDPILGYSLFDKEYIDFEIKEGKIWLLKDDEEE